MLRVRTQIAMLMFGMAIGCAWTASAQAQHFGNRNAVVCRDYQYGTPDLFYNYYVPPTCGGMGAELYPAPLPVPPHVGQVYYTYQPLMPHEFLYRHHRSYHRYYNDGRGLTRTSVIWW